MSINNSVAMIIFLCLICFSIYAKINVYFFFSRWSPKMARKWFLGKVASRLCTYPAGHKFVEITLSCTVSEINVLLRFMQKFKMAAKTGGKTIFGKSRQLILRIPCWSKFCQNHSISHGFWDKCVFWFYTKMVVKCCFFFGGVRLTVELSRYPEGQKFR